MRVQVNGEDREIDNGSNIVALLASLELPSTRVAVEVNKTLIRRADHAGHELHEGDHIEVVTFVGGG